MTRRKLSRIAVWCWAIAAVVSVLIFVFADGPRRWYSGGFFALISVIMFVNSLRWWKEAGGD